MELKGECVSFHGDRYGDIVKQCLHCIDGKAGALKLCSPWRVLGEVVCRKEVGDVIPLYFHVGTGGAFGDNDVDNKTRKYSLVLV